ncbi:hypothetical protein CC85DRAFT_129889 [Cutaneotrichosporon oleaginosum]|uniref:Postreplication repair E3 ubiquitin-protein ligase RAD18 n=1 Tax=Cutaneotrichosporon oleaginosum TaxID=879819 RepID=A0A0J0XIZ7_9TREE|nr:uncharacterized protein CC85DRAFT_129889 [Cutaneotrichosporon oleaginosum]KLT41047.1 hypothetical protein CC85DRAFT_129889 [Cutaneotrichosporon oleaginosum]TXT12139.1 hypothetical protein COLE_02549 [Cutaneotrichosporon oleaginosum]
MDTSHPLLQAGDDPKPFPPSFSTFVRLDKAFLCPICKELLSAPVSIACGHSFCSACIRSSLTHAKKCPSCGEAASEGAIRRNRALEEMTDAWEAARPQLLEFTKPRKRPAPSSGPPSVHSLKRARTQSPSKSESQPRSTSPSEGMEVMNSSDAEVDELSENDEAPCPICGVKLEISAIPGHIDRGCPPPKAKAAPAKTTWKKLFAGAGVKGKTAEMKRIVKPNYSLISIGDLRGLLAEHGLPTTGDRPTLEARFQEWTILYNANLDTSHPAALPALRAKLANAEASRRRDRDKGKEEEVEALASKEGLAKHAREQRSEFERLRQDVLDRKARKARGEPDGQRVDTAIEVE